ncbi:hypothetical protein DER44DRAFT_807266 [Fusarium oxysporum]|nr:hypothetical protein DER44DRAFT_807266 [Fusarium oxysporum]
MPTKAPGFQETVHPTPTMPLNQEGPPNSDNVHNLMFPPAYDTTRMRHFTSTALLSDVGSGIIIDSQSLKISYGINSSFGGSLAASGGYIAARPLSYPAFAEYTEPASPRDGITDTGLSMRAFLPIDPRSSREALISYNGMATVMDTRVACMRPTFANVTVQSYGIYRWIAGSVWTKLKVPRMNTTLGMDGDVQPSHFNCSYSLEQGDPDSSLRISFCNVYFMDENDDRDTGIISDMEPIPPEPYTASSPGGMYLIINTTGAHTDWNEVNNAGRNLRIETVVQDKSEWTTLESDVKGLSFVMTLCSFDPVVQDMNITATRTKGGAEPMARWLNSTSTYDTEAILAQLGGTKDHLSYDDRGIFKLAKKESWLTPPSIIDRGTYWESSPAPPADPYYILFGAFDGLPGGGGYLIDLFGPDDSGDANGIRLNRLHGEVFKETIKATGSAAWAIQALVTSLYSMAYYDYIFQFDIPAPADLKAEQRAKDGLIGGSWAAVARISGQPTDDWLAKASTMTDTEISKGLQNVGQQVKLVGLSASRNLITPEDAIPDQHAVVISNYNRPENPMFMLLTMQRHTMSVSKSAAARQRNESVGAARATAAVPPYFKPYEKAETKEMYLDGALYHNCPVWVAHHEKSGRLGDILNCNRIWESFFTENSQLHGRSLPDGEQRYIRINPDLGESLPRLDDVSMMEEVERKTSRYLKQNRELVKETAHRLIASTFFFETDPSRIKHVGNGFRCQDNSSSGSIDRSFPISGFPRELVDEHRQPGPPRTTVNSELRRDSSGRRFPYTRAMHNKGSIDEHDLDALGNLTLSPWLTDPKNGSNMF